MSERSAQSRTVDAIHRTSAREMLSGPAQAASGLFTKTNTPSGATITDTPTGGAIATVQVSASADGSVSEAGSTYACPAVAAVHRAVTAIVQAVDSHRS